MGTAANPKIPKNFAELGLTNQDDDIGINDFVSKSARMAAPFTVGMKGNLLGSVDRNAVRIHTDVTADGNNNRASSFSQIITIAPGDIDVNDQKLHLRFLGAPVLDASAHTVEALPYYFIDVVRNPDEADETVIYTDYNYANQAGIKWETGVSGYKYTDWVEYDIALDASKVQVNDKVQLRITAAGCDAGGHAGAFYLRDVRTEMASNLDDTLWITVESNPAAVYEPVSGEDFSYVTYTYTYKNNGNTTVNNVAINPTLPVTSNIRNVSQSFPTELISIGTPTFGTDIPSCNAGKVTELAVADNADPACTIGTLAPGESGTFTMVVKVPSKTQADSVNNGYYPIMGTNVDPISGQMVKTPLLARITPDVCKVPTFMPFGQSLPPTAGFSCTNTGATEAVGASCMITGLPTGVTVGQCTVSPGAANWNQGSDIPMGQTVSCPLTGTPTDPSQTSTPIKVTGDTTNGPGSDVGTPTPQEAPVVGQGPGGAVLLVAPSSVPTMSEWGLIVMSSVMALFAFGMRRRLPF